MARHRRNPTRQPARQLEQELAEERARIERRRDEDRKIDHDRLTRIERDIHDMHTLVFAAFQRRNGD